MGSGASTDVGALVGALKNPDVPNDKRLKALKRLGELANNKDEAYKICLASDELGLLKELASLLAKEREPGGDAEAVVQACEICRSLSLSGAAMLNLVSPSNDLLPILVKISGAGLGEVIFFVLHFISSHSLISCPHHFIGQRSMHCSVD
jgi:hypothetical protein